METVAHALPEAIPQVVSEVQERAAEDRWNTAARIAFRFVCSLGKPAILREAARAANR
jgi:hypothetical protein